MMIRRICATTFLAAAVLGTCAATGNAAGPPEQDRFLEESRQSSPSLYWWTDERMLEIGYLSCDAFDNRGATVETLKGIIAIGAEENAEVELRVLAGTASEHLCAQYEVPVAHALAQIDNGA
ncbi:hypothetical protein ACFO5K_26635 [Nocardia halotolerans]|uniref:DUF732 domain-containing protein n=1 Tax=Nocardia halotolerans TaxID=1755878 RepID=A0ABV8VPR5_9NOCA